MLPCMSMKSTGSMHCEQWSLIWSYLPKMQITGAIFFSLLSWNWENCINIAAGYSYPCGQLKGIRWLSGLGTAPKASHLHGSHASVTLPLWHNAQPSTCHCGWGNRCRDWLPSPRWRYRNMAAPDMEVTEDKISSASLHEAAAASLCRGCSLCTRPAASFN